MRYAIRIGYDGRYFNGFSIQPDIKTVEGEIIKKLKETKLIDGRKEASFQYASRTDKGVSAFGNVISLNTPSNPAKIINEIENIWVTGYAEVGNSFNPRHASWKRYRYYLTKEMTDGIDIGMLRKAAELFEGEHDYSSFCRNDGRYTIRKIDAIDIIEGDTIKIDFIARSFLWQQVRRIVWAMLKAAAVEIDMEKIKNALNGIKLQTGAAPPENLVLMEVHYDNVSFTKFISDKLVLKREMMNDAIGLIEK
ncbi:MAG: tRNA pseudouridine(38-40) synthase TruA [Thermoplasmata archaeon]|nr:tRNA pseudouridine(38-40) synthase TruA [Thermoplasmata archaeon]